MARKFRQGQSIKFKYIQMVDNPEKLGEKRSEEKTLPGVVLGFVREGGKSRIKVRVGANTTITIDPEQVV